MVAPLGLRAMALGPDIPASMAGISSMCLVNLTLGIFRLHDVFLRHLVSSPLRIPVAGWMDDPFWSRKTTQEWIRRSSPGPLASHIGARNWVWLCAQARCCSLRERGSGSTRKRWTKPSKEEEKGTSALRDKATLLVVTLSPRRSQTGVLVN